MPFKIDPNISAGNIMNAIMLILAAVGTAWGVLRSGQPACPAEVQALAARF